MIKLRDSIKVIAGGTLLVALAPVWGCVVIGQRLLDSEEVFLFFSHFFALLPGKPGDFVRRAYYRWTLSKTSSDFVIGFGSFCTHRDVKIGDGVWIGQYTILGRVTINSDVLISDHVSVLSGQHHHKHDESGVLADGIDLNESRVVIEKNAWIGANALVMANIGNGSIIGAGSVVAKPIKSHTVVVGNPARTIRDLPHGSNQ